MPQQPPTQEDRRADFARRFAELEEKLAPLRAEVLRNVEILERREAEARAREERRRRRWFF